MQIKGNNFIVTGGAGFIGSKLVQRLLDRDANNILVIDNFTYGSRKDFENKFGKEFRVDLADEDIIGTITYPDWTVHGIFHLASLNLLDCEKSPYEAWATNIDGFSNILELCEEKKCKLVFSSSASIYGDAVEEPMKETHPHNFQNVYGGTKAACEDLFQAWHHKYKINGASLRYMNVYGPGMHDRGAYVSVIIKFLDRIFEGKPPIIYGTGGESFDFIHVNDVVDANVCAMENSKGYGAYNVGRGIKTSINELLGTMLEILELDGKQEIECRPNDRNFTVTNRVGDVRKAEVELGFTWQVPLKAGLTQTINWYKGRRIEK